MNYSLKSLYYTIIGTITFFSCSEDLVMPESPEVTTEETMVYSPDSLVRYNGRYLEFSSPEILQETLQILANNETDKIYSRLNILGFESMMDVFLEAKRIESDFFEALEADSKIVATNQQEFDEALRKKIQSLEYIQNHSCLFTFNDNGSIQDLKIFDPNLAHLVNIQGILKVAGHLFQYTETETKIIVQGDEKKIEKLEFTHQDDIVSNIIVRPIEIVSSPNAENARTAYSGYTEFNNNSKRIEATVKLIKSSIPIYGACEWVIDCDDPTTNLKVLPPPGPPTPDCHEFCERPIVGYEYKSHYYVRAHYRKKAWYSVFTAWVDWTPDVASFNITSNLHNKNRCYEDVYDDITPIMTYTIHDGPRIDVKNASHYFGAGKDGVSHTYIDCHRSTGRLLEKTRQGMGIPTFNTSLIVQGTIEFD